ncbi:MAG: phenylalanine--tRNA ligase subunit beta [Candidatus Paceibacterota bacterium]|jgi:phenylalanyl-tRNA synthetase beta chain
MKVSHKWLQTYFDAKIPDADTLADLFAMHSFEVEGVEDIKNTDGSADSVLDIKVLPDRAHYALSHKGIADEISFLTDMLPKKRYVEALSANADHCPIVKLENDKFCRRYIARCIEINSKAGLPPVAVPKAGLPAVALAKAGSNNFSAYLKSALESIGQRSINPIVDITNYVMYDIGQPLHAFDADKVKGPITVRSAKEGEKIVLLDGREIILTSDDNVIADEDGPLVIAGAKGGKRAEVSESTKRIIIESANFDPTAVRRTSTKYDIRSDSSKRFENEITPELAIHGMNNACALIKERYPNAVFGPIVDEYQHKSKDVIVDFDPAYVKERLGIEVPADTIKNILMKMNMGVVAKGNIWSLTIPHERLDLRIREDIVEEIGRVYGYEKIAGKLPAKATTDPITELNFSVSERLKNILTGIGFSEVSLYSLVEKGDIETLKPLAKDKAFIRKNLTEGILSCVHKNVLNADLLGLDSIKIFEIGRVFTHNQENVVLSLGSAQVKKMKGVNGGVIIENAIKEIFARLNIGLSVPKIISQNQSYACEIDLSEILSLVRSVSNTGSKSSSVTSTSAIDLEFKALSDKRYTKYSQYPFIVRDIAVFVPESIDSNGVWNTIEGAIKSADASDLLVRHLLFDTFKKEGKVSYAFRMVFQSMDRTLTDDEVSKVMNAINVSIKKEGWEVR